MNGTTEATALHPLASASKALARKLHLGKVLLQARSAYAVGPSALVRVAYARRVTLPHIKAWARMPCGRCRQGWGEGEGIELHMLLGHARLLEGAWAVRSFGVSANRPLDLVVHDDGTLTREDGASLAQLFPGIRLVGRDEADRLVNDHLRSRGLGRSEHLRRTLVFGLKLFDPFLFLKRRTFLLLDSDVLFYARPAEALDAIDRGAATFSVDNGYRYALGESELGGLIGVDCARHVNPGVLVAPDSLARFEQIEEWLAHPGFWNQHGAASYYAELTIWAMLMTLAGGKPLPSAYGICTPDPRAAGVVSGHYCGDGYWAARYYTHGLPHLSDALSTWRAAPTPGPRASCDSELAAS